MLHPQQIVEHHETRPPGALLTCAYCGGTFLFQDRRRHVDVNFTGPDCQLATIQTTAPAGANPSEVQDV